MPRVSSQNNLPELEHLATLSNSTPNGANISLPPETIQHNLRVTIEEWPNPNANWGLSNELMYDGLQIPPEDLHRAPDDIYACGHDVNDWSEAAQQFSKWSDHRLLEFLQEELGSKFVKEWRIFVNKESLTTEDTRMLKMLSAQLWSHFSQQTYREFWHEFSEELNLPSKYLAWRRAKNLSGISAWKFRHLDSCPFCKEKRFNHRARPRKVFWYIPLIPQLQALFQNLSMIEKLCYRSLCHAYTRKLGDFFGGAHYQSLRNIQPSPNSPYRLFDNFRDLALGFALDGFSLFKRRRKGNSTAWPLILELLELEIGVPTKDCSAAPSQQWFKLRAFLVLAFGDIPALSKLLGVKGHNAFAPCRGEDYWDIEDLPMRTPELFESHLAEIEASSTKTAREKTSSSLRRKLSRQLFAHPYMGTIGAETAAALKFIPAQFVGTIHDIDQDISLYKAEGYSFWMLYLAPILLKGRLPSKYSIKQAQIDYLEEKIQNWVADYEAPASILGTPIHRKYPLNNQLFNQLLRYFCLYLTPTPTRSTFQAMIDIESVTRYGRVRIAGGGDRFRVAKSDSNPWDRDNTFVRFIMYPDANASFRNRADQPVRQVNYGQLLDIIYLKLKPNEHYSNVDLEYLLAHILPCETFTHDDATSTLVEYQKMAGHSIVVHLNSVEAVVGRAKRDDTWGIIDRSNGAVRNSLHE
ncbi:Transposase family tnp2 [Rhizoctonia solani]|uniref:Transposase family tnp2 n=1 Tax=Rhizoctonia solani TaxID=456999 RepID=A0A8H7HZX3_9AGAM|nr:Transposase family tnp2 [Rhizoctonia solani]